MDIPIHDRGLNELALACDERAGELQARAWQSEAERNALREATAELLGVVARQLASGTCHAKAIDAPPSRLSAADLRTIIDTRVCHQPLHVSPAHTWVRDFAPGGNDRTGS